jgi:hypothetical protein
MLTFKWAGGGVAQLPMEDTEDGAYELQLMLPHVGHYTLRVWLGDVALGMGPTPLHVTTAATSLVHSLLTRETAAGSTGLLTAIQVLPRLTRVSFPQTSTPMMPDVPQRPASVPLTATVRGVGSRSRHWCCVRVTPRTCVCSPSTRNSWLHSPPPSGSGCQ